MKHIYLSLPGTTTEYIPLFDKCRVIGAKATSSVKQTSASALVQIQKNSASHATLQVDLNGISVTSVASLSAPSSATAAEQKQIFGPDTPIEVKTDMKTAAASAVVGVTLLVDDYMVGGDEVGS